MNRLVLLTSLVLAAGSALSTLAVEPVPGEFHSASAWFEGVFSQGTTAESRPWMKLISQDVAEPMTRGRSWRGTPYQISTKTYSHGLALNASKRILVHLPRPGEKFTAEVGLENNDDTRRGAGLGNGSVTFHVRVGGKEVFASGIRRLHDAPVAIDVPLEGAQEFEIEVGDARDGRGWDQAVWAEAVVRHRDGSTLRLQDIPLVSGETFGNASAFAFVLAGQKSDVVLAKSAPKMLDHRALDRIVRTLTWELAQLEIRAEATLFTDFPAVEWIVYFQNRSGTNTPLLEEIQAMDCAVPVASAGKTTLHWAKGGVASFDDFAPQSAELKAGTSFALSSGEGRSSSQVLPFFNVEGANGGVIAAVGWTGTWAADFRATPEGDVRMKSGLQRTHLVLGPGESIRSPRMLLLFYEGERMRGQNLLRQFILSHHRPQPRGLPLVAPVTCGNWGGTPAEIHLDNIQNIIQHDLPIAYYWIDAEWYGQGSWPVNVGNWTTKADLYPQGFKPLSDNLKKSGRELMLWFEPERVFKGSTWQKEHADWLLQAGGDNYLFNLGNSAARTFLIDFISARIDEFGLGCYRQDFNIDPAPFWRSADAPDRQGITEIKYIEGLYAFWDELLRRHPGLIIDNCASGGRRIDLETVGRATPFWRTDGPRDPVAHQCHSFGLLQWIPMSATSQDRAGDDYEFRSSMCSGLCLNWWVSGDAPAERIPPTFPFDWAKRTLAQYTLFRDCFYGDFYPLTTYSQSPDTWMAYQLDSPKTGKGVLVVLRRSQSPFERARFTLHGIDPKASYVISDVDLGTQDFHSGSQLLSEGLSVTIAKKPGSALLIYQRR